MEQELDRPRKLEFEPRLLVLFLFISIPFILIGSLLILQLLGNEMNNRLGQNLAELAGANARYLDTYILVKVTSVSRLSVTPTLTETVDLANRRHGPDARSAHEAILETDNAWKKSGGLSSLALDIVNSKTSSLLRKFASFNPAYLEILLADRHGALVAATNIATDYYQADEDWWRNAYGDGQAGAIYVSNARFDPSAKVEGIEIAVPVKVPFGEGEIVGGVLKALIDIRDLHAVLGSVRAGASGHAVLVDGSDRTVISGAGAESTSKEYPGFVSLQEAVAEGRRHFVCQHDDGTTWLTGFSRMPEPGPSPEIAWYVLVEQLLEEARQPVKTATAYLLWFFGSMVFLVLAFSLYMHFRLVRPIREIDLREEMERLSTAPTR